jgi:hypothetical protein
MTPERLGEYAALVRDFLAGSTSVGEFERRYLARFKAEPSGMAPAVFDILNELFCDVDCYSPECRPGQEDAWNITEETLRRRAAHALTRIRDLGSGSPMTEPRAPCPCCRCKTLATRSSFEVCPVCFWEDDGQDDADADVVKGGPNGDLSLTRARENYRALGACDPRHVDHVRPPRRDEQP